MAQKTALSHKTRYTIAPLKWVVHNMDTSGWTQDELEGMPLTTWVHESPFGAFRIYWRKWPGVLQSEWMWELEFVEYRDEVSGHGESLADCKRKVMAAWVDRLSGALKPTDD